MKITSESGLIIFSDTINLKKKCIYISIAEMNLIIEVITKKKKK